MKRLLTLALAAASVAFADPTTTLVNTSAQRTLDRLRNYNEISFGPDVFWQHFSEEKIGAKVETDGVFGGARLRYEYVKPGAFYSGTDGMFAAGRTREKTGIVSPVKYHQTAIAANLEQRFGYTFAVSGIQSTLAPFIGLGWYYTKPVATNRYSNDFIYAAAGFKAKQEVSSCMDIGLVGKALYSFYDRTHVEGVVNSTWDDRAWGVEVDLPITWHLNESRTWELVFEPYFQDLDVKNNYINAGGRLLAGYQF
jgi:hypothetical protein